MATGNELLDGLAGKTAGFASLVKPGVETLDFMVSVACDITEPNTGFQVNHAKVPITETDVLYVSPALLALLEYPDQDSYKAALASGALVHTGDVQVATEHVANRISASYDVRLLRGDGSNTYRRLRIRAMSMLFNGVETRFIVFKVP